MIALFILAVAGLILPLFITITAVSSKRHDPAASIICLIGCSLSTIILVETYLVYLELFK